jgi:hypothetical protein
MSYLNIEDAIENKIKTSEVHLLDNYDLDNHTTSSQTLTGATVPLNTYPL